MQKDKPFAIFRSYRTCKNGLSWIENGQRRTIIHLCGSHMSNTFIRNMKVLKIHVKAVRLFAYILRRMAKCTELKDVNILFFHLCRLCTAEKFATTTEASFKYLRAVAALQQEEQAIDVDEEDSDGNGDPFSNDQSHDGTYRECSPFGRHFEIILNKLVFTTT